jgi:GNAT superfamily N-acetyltransferase
MGIVRHRSAFARTKTAKIADADPLCYRRAMKVAVLGREQLAAAELVLADACPFDRATDVAEEKLFEPAPAGPSIAFGAWDGSELVGVAAISARWLRLIAVVPRARRRGAGSALLAACEEQARAYLASAAMAGVPTKSAASGATTSAAPGATTAISTATGATISTATGATSAATPPLRLRVLDQPGNYLAPGVDERNADAIAWLEKRGFERGAELRENVLVNVRGNPKVTLERLAQSIAAAAERGYEVRRARVDEREALTDAVRGEFGGAWPFEIARALAHEPAGVHVALKEGAYCAFAAHDGNNAGLGWFGPTGTWPAHRGQGLGEATLLACLLDVAAEHAQCEVAWIGPRPFYEKVAGIASTRRFVALSKQL